MCRTPLWISDRKIRTGKYYFWQGGSSVQFSAMSWAALTGFLDLGVCPTLRRERAPIGFAIPTRKTRGRCMVIQVVCSGVKK